MVNATLPFGPTLETERLILRPPGAEDFDAYAALMSDEEAARYIGGVQVRPVAWRGFTSIIGAWVVNGHSMFSVIEKSTGRWIGRIGPWVPEGWPGPEVGWGLVRDAWGKGYAFEAATRSIDWVFDKLGWDEVVHTIHPDNANSIALAKRLGSAWMREAALPPPVQHFPVHLYGQNRAAWRERQGRK